MKEQDFSGIQQVIYIKLGEGGSWERQCLQDGTIRVGFYEVPSDLAQSRDVAAIRQWHLVVHIMRRKRNIFTPDGDRSPFGHGLMGVQD